MSFGQSFLDPNTYSHLQGSTQRAPSMSSPLAQPFTSAAGRTRLASRRAQYNAAKAASEADQLEIQRFEDPAASNQEIEAIQSMMEQGSRRRRVAEVRWIAIPDLDTFLTLAIV